MSKITILGAGIAGVSCSYHAKKLGIECVSFEANFK